MSNPNTAVNNVNNVNEHKESFKVSHANIINSAPLMSWDEVVADWDNAVAAFHHRQFLGALPNCRDHGIFDCECRNELHEQWKEHLYEVLFLRAGSRIANGTYPCRNHDNGVTPCDCERRFDAEFHMHVDYWFDHELNLWNTFHNNNHGVAYAIGRIANRIIGFVKIEPRDA